MELTDMRQMANHIVGAFGGTPKVYGYLDNNGISSIEILSSVDGCFPNVLSTSTLGLAGHSINKCIEDKELRIEIAGAAYVKYHYMPNIISTCAFNVINSNMYPSHQSVHENVIFEYYKDYAMKHVFYASPYIWGDLSNIEYDNMLVTWLLAIPISDAELDFYLRHGATALEYVFESEGIDIFDLERRSTL